MPTPASAWLRYSAKTTAKLLRSFRAGSAARPDLVPRDSSDRWKSGSTASHFEPLVRYLLRQSMASQRSHSFIRKGTCSGDRTSGGVSSLLQGAECASEVDERIFEGRGAQVVDAA